MLSGGCLRERSDKLPPQRLKDRAVINRWHEEEHTLRRDMANDMLDLPHQSFRASATNDDELGLLRKSLHDLLPMLVGHVEPIRSRRWDDFVGSADCYHGAVVRHRFEKGMFMVFDWANTQDNSEPAQRS